MADTKKYLDYEGLKTYHEKAKSEYDSKYALKGDMPEVDLSGYVTTENADQTYALKSEMPDTSGLATKAEVKTGNEQLSGSIDEVKGNVTTLEGKVKAFEEAGYLDQEAAKKIIAEAQHIKKEVVETLPSEAEGVENVIYLVKKAGEDKNVYDEYLLINGSWELIGDTQTEIDLSEYPTKEEVNQLVGEATGGIVIESITVSEIDKLFNSNSYPRYDENGNMVNGLYPSPDNFLRVWAGEELIAEIESPTEISEFQFNDQGVTRVELPSSVTSIGGYAFSNNQLTSITIPDSVTSIGDDAFSGNQLTSVTVPEGITTLYGAFDGNQLTSITIPDSVTSIRDNAFSNNQLTSVTIPNSVTSIGDYAFNYNPLETVSISRSTKFESNSFPETAEIIYRD